MDDDSDGMDDNCTNDNTFNDKKAQSLSLKTPPTASPNRRSWPSTSKADPSFLAEAASSLAPIKSPLIHERPKRTGKDSAKLTHKFATDFANKTTPGSNTRARRRRALIAPSLRHTRRFDMTPGMTNRSSNSVEHSSVTSLIVSPTSLGKSPTPSSQLSLSHRSMICQTNQAKPLSVSSAASSKEARISAKTPVKTAGKASAAGAASAISPAAAAKLHVEEATGRR